MPAEGATPVISLPAQPMPSRPEPNSRRFLALFGTSQLAFGILLLHAPLGVILKSYPFLATGHALFMLGLGLFFAIGRKHDYASLVVGYIAGAEVLWRMTDAQIIWEFGKYAATFICIVSLLGTRGKTVRWTLPILFFALLLPSAFVPFADSAFEDARSVVSFYMSGPLSIAVSLVYFANFQVTKSDADARIQAAICPIVGIAAICVSSTASASKLVFEDESNFVVTGGFGPNQVSTILGLGALLCFIRVMDTGNGRSWVSLIFLGLGAGFLTCGALTFSRGGVYSAAIGALLYVLLGFQKQNRARLVGILAVGFVAFQFLIAPFLVDITGGAISERFGSTNPTGRAQLADNEMDAWSENPLFGVGVGQSKEFREQAITGAASHTEISRLLAEHGLLGAFALLILGIIAIRTIRDSRGEGRARAAMFLGWALSTMMHSAVRTYSPCWAIGFSAMTINDESTPSPGGDQQSGIPERPQLPFRN